MTAKAWPNECPSGVYKPPPLTAAIHDPDFTTARPWTPADSRTDGVHHFTGGYLEVAACRHCERLVLGPLPAIYTHNQYGNFDWYCDLYVISEQP